MRLTELELKALKAIATSEYGEGVWINCIWGFEGKERQLGGLISSLSRKGVLNIVGGGTDDAYVVLTDEGKAAWALIA